MKKGFTLVELIVTIGLLALIGASIGISLNRSIKKQNENNYIEYVSRIKSAANLYASNNSEILNSLYTNKGYVEVTAKDIINDGYLNKNTYNPNTKKTIEETDKIRLSLDANGTISVEYPTTEITNDYLQAIDIIIDYKEGNNIENKDYCYEDKNTPTLAYVDKDGNIKADYLQENETIKCTGSEKVDSNKPGTYELKYEYKTETGEWRQKTRKVLIIDNTVKIPPTIKFTPENGYYTGTSDYSSAFITIQVTDYSESGIDSDTLVYSAGKKISDTAKKHNGYIWVKLLPGDNYVTARACDNKGNCTTETAGPYKYTKSSGGTSLYSRTAKFYKYNGTSLDTQSQKQCTCSSSNCSCSITPPTAPVRTGYVFTGWGSSTNCTSGNTNSTITLSNVETSFYACYDKNGTSTTTTTSATVPTTTKTPTQEVSAPSTPIIKASDSIVSGYWHNADNLNLTINGSTISNGSGTVIYYYWYEGLDEKNAIRYNNPIDLNGITSLNMNYYAKACNSLDTSVCSVPRYYQLKIDRIAPTITFNPNGAKIKSATNQSIVITAADNSGGAGIYSNSLKYSKGQSIIGTGTTYTNGASITITLSDGDNYITATACDKAGTNGNCTTTTSASYTKSGTTNNTTTSAATTTTKKTTTTTKAATQVLAPSDPTITANDNIETGDWHNKNTTLTFSGSTISNGYGNVVYYYGTNINNLTSTGSNTGSISTEGITTYYVIACNDKNTSICSGVTGYVLQIDKTKPNLTYTNHIGSATGSTYNGSTTWANQNVYTVLDYSDSGSGIDTTTLQYKRGTNSYTRLVNNVGNSSYTGIWEAEGDYTGYHKICDKSGNCSEVSYPIKIDKTIPTIDTFYIGGNNNPTYATSTSSSKYITWSNTDVSLYCVNTSNSTSGCTWYSGTSPLSVVQTLTSGDGTKTLYAFIKDKAGNISSSKSDSIVLDTTAPTLTVANKKNNTNKDSYAGSWTMFDVISDMEFSDSGSGINASSLKIKYSDAASWTNISNSNTSKSSYTWSCSSNSYLDKTANIQICDNAGKCTDKSFAIKIDKTYPSLTVTNTVNGYAYSGTCTTSNINSKLSYSDTGSGIDTSAVYWKCTGSWDTSYFSDKTSTGTTFVFDAIRNTTCSFQVCDKVGNCSSQSFKICKQNSSSGGGSSSGTTGICCTTGTAQGENYRWYSNKSTCPTGWANGRSQANCSGSTN